MKTIVPDYYKNFKCIADKCRHTCCKGWEVTVDDESLEKYRDKEDILKNIGFDGGAHFVLDEAEKCPFLRGDGLCEMIINHSEDSLCQICRDHPRFRNFWSDRCETGLGLVCEEACRIILEQKEPMRLEVLEDDGENEELPEDEKWLLSYRNMLLDGIKESKERARLLEYLIFRHIPDALYDGRLEERESFIFASFREMTDKWEKTDGTLVSLVEICREWSYDVEYDEDELEKRISSFEKEE